jgi:hypothetical protein
MDNKLLKYIIKVYVKQMLIIIMTIYVIKLLYKIM